MAMISLERDGKRFNYRAVGVLIDNGRVLIHRAATDDFWALPGGRCEIGESAAATVVREFQEEIGATVEVERPLWVAETFFEYKGKQHHELGIYLLLRLPADSPLPQHSATFYGTEGDLTLIFQWLDLDDAADVRLYPLFLRQRLGDLPMLVEHIVHTDPKDEDDPAPRVR